MVPSDLVAEKDIPFALPFIDTSFAHNLFLVFVFWPIWWFLGIDFFIPLIFLSWEFLRFIWLSRGRLFINHVILFAFLYFLWSLFPVLWVKADDLDLFLKVISGIFSMSLFLLLFFNLVKDRRDLKKILLGLFIFGGYNVVGSLIAILGIWRGEITTIMGGLLPNSLISGSEFFSSIATRSFGIQSQGGFITSYRVFGFTTNTGPLSTICVLLIPFTVWFFLKTKGLIKKISFGLLSVGLFTAFIFTDSRFGYISLLLGFAFFIVLRFLILEKKNIFFVTAILLLTLSLVIIIGYFTYNEITSGLTSVFIDYRVGSLAVRLEVYSATLELFTQHPIAGWGHTVKIAGLPSVYSAGSHSFYLGILFKHGVIGLLIYLLLIISVWKIIAKNVRFNIKNKSVQTLWIVLATALFSLNVREFTSDWFWDQSVAIVVLTFFGLIVAAPKIFSLGK